MTVTVDAVLYFRIQNATVSVTNVTDAQGSTKLLAQTTLRNIIGTKNLSEILMDREGLSSQMQVQITTFLLNYVKEFVNKYGVRDYVT